MMHQALKPIRIGEILPSGNDHLVTEDVTPSVYDSHPMRDLRRLLAEQGLRVEPRPFVYKDLSPTLVRLMFAVSGGRVEDGAVASVVCLFDRQADRTLYAHPMHAGPNVNPLVRYTDGPMAGPQSQDGADGDRASRRIIEHKQALWERYLEERPKLGDEVAGRRWREGYLWALQRLYFCSGCVQCKWGSPFFDGPDASLPRIALHGRPPIPVYPLSEAHERIVQAIIASDAWGIEAAYAKRGGFTLVGRPWLLKRLDDNRIQVIFPMDTVVVQGGSLVAAAFMYDLVSRRVLISHCLVAGPECDIQFIKADVAFGLPRPQPGEAGEVALLGYRAWRRAGWSRYWLNDLEHGPAHASQVWLGEFWEAVRTLYGGNELSRDEAEGSSQPIVDAAVHRAIQRHAPVVPPQALENIGGRCFSGHATHGSAAELRAIEISTLMVNLGRRCNQACRHCHVDAGPNRTEEMDRETVDDVLAALTRFGIATLDITGGAPELNPHFRYLASEAARRGVRVVDRCNLTILFEPGQEDLPEFLAKHGIHVTASLPSDEETVADQQRGAGTFAKSVAALHKLNALGYGRAGSGLMLNLVFNPSGTELHPPQSELERRYKHELLRRYGIEFNHLLAMNNMPINRFESYLKREGRAADYIDGLAASFNRDAVGGLMCRHSMSVGWDGRLYDCDFNQVLDIPLDRGMPVHIREFNADMLRHRVIRAAKHCFGCTAGTGSSCNGALVGETIQLNVESRRNGRVPAVGEAHA